MSCHLHTTALSLNLRNKGESCLPGIVCITDRKRVPNLQQTLKHLPQGSMVILRDYDHPNRLEYAKQIQKQCKDYNHFMLVGGSPTLAQQIQADGLHIPEKSLIKLQRWHRLKPQWMFTTSAHSPVSLLKAEKSQVDAILYSPIFATGSGEHKKPLGVTRFARETRNCSTPIYALGGITNKNVLQLQHTNAIGIAAVEGLNPSS